MSERMDTPQGMVLSPLPEVLMNSTMNGTDHLPFLHPQASWRGPGVGS